MKACRILIVDDHTLFRAGLAIILKQDARVTDTLEAASVMDALAHAQEKIDLVLLDIQLPGPSGLEGLSELRARFVDVPIMILSASSETWAVRRAMQQGAAGFLHKSASAQEIQQAIRSVLRGRPCFPPEPESVAGPPDAQQNLTERQRDVLTLLCQGKTNKAIGRELGMAENTVRVHVSAILAYLGAASRGEAMLAAQQLGLVAQLP